MTPPPGFSLDDLLRGWPFDPQALSVRLITAADQREVIQMRIEMGVLQMETTGRPDGSQPLGAPTMLDLLLKRTRKKKRIVLNEDECRECDREFVQFYHRRICWLELRRYDRAVEDACHTLKLMDACRQLSPSEAWTITHEQYRPFVIYHRVYADALRELGETDASSAIQVINLGVHELQKALEELGAEEEDEGGMVGRLEELREDLRARFEVGPTLQEQLLEAIQREQYELAARIRDEISKQTRTGR